MGGIGTGLKIEPQDPPAGKKRSTPRALHTAISRAILDLVWTRCGWGAFRQTAGAYLAEERSEGVAQDLWSADADHLSWSFMDHAGCCNGSSTACYHWFAVCLVAYRERWDKMAAGRGWRIATPARPAAAALFGADALLAHKDQPLCVPRFDPGRVDWHDEWSGPYWDDGAPRPSLPDLDEGTRRVAVHAAITGMCACGLCARLWPWAYHRSPVEVLHATWLALADPALRPVAAEVTQEVALYDAWRASPAGPPSLQVLSDQLAERLPQLAKPWEVAGMCFQLR